LKRKMQDRNKNNGKGFPDFFRYNRNEMSGKERNSFERELQKDPFAEEAAEGFKTITPEQATTDLSDLHAGLEKRINKRSRVIYFRIAASFAVLMLISSLFVLIQRNRSHDNGIPATAMNETLEITSHEPLREPEIHPTSSERSPEKTAQIRKSLPEAKDSNDIEINEFLVASEAAPVKDMDSVSNADIQKPYKNENLSSAESIPRKAVMPGLNGYHITGKIISSDDNAPLAGAAVTIALQGKVAGVMTDTDGNFNIEIPDSGTYKLTASYIGSQSKVFAASGNSPVVVDLNPSVTSLSEIVVTAMGIKREEVEENSDLGKYIPPRPEGGKPEFDRYLKENIRRPDTLNSEKRLVVVINFLVHTDGSVDSIMIVRSPGKPFSEEAIRLLRYGPRWQPAEDAGRSIDDHVRLRILFKQDD
jgi:hypothetical protein